MKRNSRSRRVCALALAAAATCHFCYQAEAGITYVSGAGTVQFTHTRGNNTATISSAAFPVVTSGVTNYSHSFSDGAGAKSTAAGGVGITTNSTTATFTLLPGTGVSETDPSKVWNSGSMLRIQLGSNSVPLQWNATAPSFGPTATAYFSVTIAGVIGSGGGGSFTPNITFRSGGAFVGSVTGTTTLSTGTFSKTITKSFPVSGGLLSSGSFTAHGNLDFVVNNDDTPSLIEPIVVDAGGAPPTARFDSEDEITPFGGASWNDPLAWSAEQEFVPGGVPNHAGDRAFFAPPNNAPRARAVSIDAATVTLGTLDIDDVFGGSMTVAANSGTLQFQVPNGGTFGTDVQTAVIQQRNTRGNALAEISAPVQLMNPLDVHVNSSAGLTISGAINTAPGLISPTPINKFGPGVLTLSGNNSFVGGIVVNEGGLVLSGAAIVNIPITAAAGTTVTFNTTSPGVIYDTDFNVGTAGGARTINVTGLGISAPGFSGAAPLTLNAPSTLSIIGNSNNTGTVTIASGTLSLTSGGNMTGVPEFVNNGVLRLDNSGLAIPDRIGNTATVRLRGSQMRIDSHPSIAVSETYGATVLESGTSTITLANGGTAALTVTSSALQRQNNSVLFLRGDNLGSATGSRLIFTAAPTLVGGGGAAGTPTVSIVPFASAGTNSMGNVPSTLATYSAATGLRPLDVGTEYLNTFAGAPANANIRIVGAATLNAPQTINALVTSFGVISGPAALTVTSGAILSVGTASIANPVNFGTAEGVVTAANLPLTLSGVVSGSGGLTKAGSSVLSLTNASNSYSGSTRVVNGELRISGNVTSLANGPLGNSATFISLIPGAGGVARLIATGPGTTTFGRNILTTGSPMGLSVIGTGPTGSGRVFEINGTITTVQPTQLAPALGDTLRVNSIGSGTGGILLSGGTIELNSGAGNNTTTLSSGTVRVGNNSALGTTFVWAGNGAMEGNNGARTISTDIFLRANPTIGGSTAIKFDGVIDLGGTRVHNINNTADTEYGQTFFSGGPPFTEGVDGGFIGELVNGGLTKAGNGRLIISGYNNYNGLTTVAAGELLVYGVKPLGDPVSGTVVNTGATLRLGQNLEFDPDSGLSLPNPARMVEPVIINGTGVGGSGALRGSAPATAVGTLTLGSAATVHVEPASTLAVLTLSDFASTLTLNGGGNLAVDRVRGGNVIINGSTLTVRPCNLTKNPRPNAASSITTLNVTGGGALNLNNNAMVINYAGASPLAATSALLSSGYNGGAWNGPGIRSATAAGAPGTAIGVAEAFETNYVGNFFGQPIDTTSLLLVYTRAGDANLDRIVNIADFSKLAANFNTPSTWARGDFNYDGTTNISDFAILASNFNQSAPPDLPRSSVPEPVSSLLLLSAAALRRRRY